MLLERIDSEMKDAARAQDKRRLGTIRLLKSQLKYREIDLEKQGKKPAQIDDAEVIGVIGSMIKQRRDSIEQYLAGNRPELAQNEREEIVILEAYLPKQLTDAELVALVQEAVTVSGAKSPKDMGGVMKALMPKVQGQAEGKRVSEAVKAALGKL
jgi:uncharacterized protein YqeY